MSCITYVATELHHCIPIVAETIVSYCFLQFLRIEEVKVSAKELTDNPLRFKSLPRIVEIATLITKWISFLLYGPTSICKLHVRGLSP